MLSGRSACSVKLPDQSRHVHVDTEPFANSSTHHSRIASLYQQIIMRCPWCRCQTWWATLRRARSLPRSRWTLFCMAYGGRILPLLFRHAYSPCPCACLGSGASNMSTSACTAACTAQFFTAAEQRVQGFLMLLLHAPWHMLFHPVLHSLTYKVQRWRWSLMDLARRAQGLRSSPAVVAVYGGVLIVIC